MFDIELPRVKVCPEHQAPFDAFADAYFGNEFNWALWYGSRGTGKSYMLALLALVKAALLEIDVTLLGGSMAQSNNVREHVEKLMDRPNAPRDMIRSMIQTEIRFTPGNWIRPLPASQKTVRGPHPAMTLLDEIDEMEKKIYDAAMGQALMQPNKRGVVVPEMVVASSTWQNPIGTFQEVIDDARKKGMPVFTWCWREVIAPNGWMPAEFIERKKASVPAEMFRVEYELGEPAGDQRAFSLDKVNKYFVPMEFVSERHAGDDDEWIIAEPTPAGIYAAGADWAKMQDKTVIVVARVDVTPREIVYVRRVNRRPWPDMIGYFNTIVNKYNSAVSAHDATGLGNVVHDLVDERTLKVELVGTKRTKLLTEYISDFEQGAYLMPRNTSLFDSHRAATVADVYGGASATYKNHLPDDVAACAIMHRAAERMAPSAPPMGVPKTSDLPAYLSPLSPDSRVEGVVWVKDQEDGVDVGWLPSDDGREGSGGVFRL